MIMEGEKKKRIKILAFFLFSIVIGTAVSAVAKNTDTPHLFVSGKSMVDYQTSIDAEKENIRSIRILTAETTKTLSEESNADAQDYEKATEQRLKDELYQLKMATGAVDVKGQGVEITLDDGVRKLAQGEDPNNVLVHDIDLLNIINDLKIAGAEALSLNGQRITNTTEISCSGYTVKVNEVFIARPFIIKAIGDAKTLKATLTAPGQYGDLLKAWGLIFRVKEQKEIVIAKYDGNQSYKYMESVKEGDIE